MGNTFDLTKGQIEYYESSNNIINNHIKKLINTISDTNHVEIHINNLNKKEYPCCTQYLIKIKNKNKINKCVLNIHFISGIVSKKINGKMVKNQNFALKIVLLVDCPYHVSNPVESESINYETIKITSNRECSNFDNLYKNIDVINKYFQWIMLQMPIRYKIKVVSSKINCGEYIRTTNYVDDN